MSPLLSITVPSYNVEKYLRKGLSTYADHRFDDSLEVLIVNDGSTDNTASIAQEFVNCFPRIFKLVNKENGGHGSAVNAGIEKASGKYFRVIDGDDWVETEGIAELLSRLSSVNADIVVDEMSRIDMATQRKEFIPFPEYISTDTELAFSEVCNKRDTESYMDIHTLTVRTSLLREHGIRLRENIFYVDYEFIVKATCFARSVEFLPIDVYQYLVGNSSQSMAANNMVERYLHHETVLKELLEFEEKTDLDADIAAYLSKKINLLVNTHLNILLIFDKNRPRGLARAKEFRSWLTREYPEHAKDTSMRFRQARILHTLGVTPERLDKIMGR